MKHSEIIASYILGEGGMGKLAKKYEVSSDTIHKHVHSNNSEITSEGHCSMCQRVKSEYSGIMAKRK